VQAGDRGEHLFDVIRGVARREIAGETEGEFGFCDPHAIGAEAQAGAVVEGALGDEPAGERAIDPDMRLAGLAGRGDLPSEARPRASRLDQCLDGIGLAARARHNVVGEPIGDPAGSP